MKRAKWVILLAVCLMGMVITSEVYARPPAEIGDFNVRMPTYSQGVTIPSIGVVDINLNDQNLAPAMNVVQGNGVIEVSDTIVVDKDVILYTRNANPIDNFGGIYTYAATVTSGTEMVVLGVDENIAISRFEIDGAPEGTHTPVIVMDCVQYQVQLPDGRVGYLVEYSDSLVGKIGRFLFGGATFSEIP